LLVDLFEAICVFCLGFVEKNPQLSLEKSTAFSDQTYQIFSNECAPFLRFLKRIQANS
jgi:hypothetical protein